MLPSEEGCWQHTALPFLTFQGLLGGCLSSCRSSGSQGGAVQCLFPTKATFLSIGRAAYAALERNPWDLGSCSRFPGSHGSEGTLWPLGKGKVSYKETQMWLLPASSECLGILSCLGYSPPCLTKRHLGLLHILHHSWGMEAEQYPACSPCPGLRLMEDSTCGTHHLSLHLPQAPWEAPSSPRQGGTEAKLWNRKTVIFL